IFCLRQLDREVKVWRRCGERHADCCTDRITSFGGGSVMVWGGISLTGKTRLVIILGNLNAESYRDEILNNQPNTNFFTFCANFRHSKIDMMDIQSGNHNIFTMSQK
uniref:Uncharacterized protein n=1 Tax=Dicentrarchus labrax TaxID=13489 RepID=A0A8P4K6T7_DICLA